MYFGSFFIVILAYLIGAVICYGKWNNKYVKHLGMIRKSFYVLYFLVITVGILSGNLDYKDWQLMLQFTAMIVFADVAVFQTPSISKLWNAEFQHDQDIKKTIEENQKALEHTSKKITCFSEVLQKTDVHFQNKEPVDTWDDYKKELEAYLRQYSDKFGFHVAFFQYSKTDDPTEKEEGIKQAIQNIIMYYNLSHSNEQQMNLVCKFLEGEGLSIKEDKLFAIPFEGVRFNFILTISSEHVPVKGIDALHLVNLATIMDWYNVE